MSLQMLATLVLVGLLTGWLAGFVLRAGGQGLLWDLPLGVVGSTVAGEIVAVLGLVADPGIFVAAVVAFAGAAIAIIAQRRVWHAPA